jgi:hypothetical protein
VSLVRCRSRCPFDPHRIVLPCPRPPSMAVRVSLTRSLGLTFSPFYSPLARSQLGRRLCA